MKRSYQVALGGICTALGLVFLLMACYIPVGELGLFGLAALTLVMPLSKGMFKTACLSYVAVSLLGLLIGNFTAILPYIVFFGIHPILIALMEKFKLHWSIRYLIKLVFFAGAGTLIFLFSSLFVGALSEAPLWAFIILGLITFLLYDFLMERIMRKAGWYIDKYIFRNQ